MIDAKAESVHMILNGIRNDIYFIVDVCPNAKEMWIAIERLQQGESINIQDVKTKLFWEFGKFTSREEESIDSYYTRFYKIMNKMTGQFGNQRTVTVVGNKETVGNQEVLHPTDDNLRPTYDTEPLEKADSNATPNSSDMCDNEGKADHNTEEPEDERVFANPGYLKKRQWEKLCLYNVKYDKNDLVNIFAPESEETIHLAEESRSKLDVGCTKHMTGNLKLLYNFIEKYLGTVRFRNDQFAPILGYGDLVQGNVIIKRVYYVEGLNHNLFSVGQFCVADLEVAFKDLQGNDLLTGTRRSDLYTIALHESSSPTPTCFMEKASPT
ncbi:hypothetical protein Tco_0139189 [Tanacetum coccineum]